MATNEVFTDEQQLPSDKEQLKAYRLEKARYWSLILYPENMIDDWEQAMSDKIGLPGFYCKHDKDLDKDGDSRKVHIHYAIMFNNTFTRQRVLELVNNTLSLPDKKCCSTAQSINNVRNMYNYFIHDTETCRKQHKHLYEPSERHTVNGFDIGFYEQLSQADKDLMAKELCDLIMEHDICNFGDFYKMVVSNYDMAYFEIVKTYSGLFERLTKSNFQKSGKKY